MVWPTILDRKIDEFDIMDLPGQQLKSAQASSYLDHILNYDITSQPACQRLTGIMASIGKASCEIEVLEKMIEVGLNIALINFNFGTIDENIETIKNIREASKNHSKMMGRNCPIAIAGVLPGKKIRTGKIFHSTNEDVELVTGEIMRLTTDETYKERCSASTVYVDYLQFPEEVSKGMRVYLDNETIALDIEVISKTTVTCKIAIGGLLGSYKDVYVPNLEFTMMPSYGKHDKDLIEIAIRHQLDFLVAPFVQNVNSVTELRQLLGETGKRIAIIANIQSLPGYKNLDSILQETNGIMLTRQELGSDITPKKMVIAQKNIILRANVANVPVIINSHILSTMRTRKIPLRSEILDVANCVIDGADALLLSCETAIGVYPVETVKVLAEICKEAEAGIWTRRVFSNLLERTPIPCDLTIGAAMGAVLAANRLLAAAILVNTTSGRSAQILSKFKPRCPIIAVTRYAPIARQLQICRAVIPVIYEEIPHPDWEKDLQIRVQFCTTWAIARGFMKVGDPFVLMSGWKGQGTANTVRVEYATNEYE